MTENTKPTNSLHKKNNNKMTYAVITFRTVIPQL